ncbi:MAG: SAM-dependent methyltransferase [Erysipelotrichaceae bacterium]|nr:SAM-dependent methyltransferase [Erysipelotrichaceae bacterium]
MISKRIRFIASLIRKDESVLDIGCDHGFLALMLRVNGNSEKIICADNKIGPLNNARKNLAGYENIDFVLSNGAQKVTEPVNVVVMSGLGYHNVTRIITSSPQYFDSVSRLIIQINTCVDQLRSWLTANGFMIVAEDIIKDYRYYQILTVEKGEQQLSELEIRYGPFLLASHSPVFCEHIRSQIDKKRQILEGIEKSNPDYQKITDQIAEMESLL